MWTFVIIFFRKIGRVVIFLVPTFILLQLLAIEKARDLPLCPETDNINWKIEESAVLTISEVKKTYPTVINARWSPSHCTPKLRLAVMVPYRNRPQQLVNFLKNMHRYFQQHNYDYIIVVIEQSPLSEFNRGMLMNIGFTEINKHYPGYYNCFALHDVDILPLNSTISYACSSGISITHLASNMDRFNYKNPYAWYVGGISVVNKESFKAINGFSNLYFGWGGEDDDLAYRLQARNGKILRYEPRRTMTKMMTHAREKENSQRQTILDQWKHRAAVDGMNSLDYKVLKTDFKDTFLHFTVEIDKRKMVAGYERKFMRTLVPPLVQPGVMEKLRLYKIEEEQDNELRDKLPKDKFEQSSETDTKANSEEMGVTTPKTLNEKFEIPATSDTAPKRPLLDLNDTNKMQSAEQQKDDKLKKLFNVKSKKMKIPRWIAFKKFIRKKRLMQSIVDSFQDAKERQEIKLRVNGQSQPPS